MSLDPILLKNKKPRRWLRVLIWLGVLGAASLAIYYLVYRIFFPSARWAQYRDFNRNPENYAEITLRPGMQCEDAPFAFPSTGAIFGLWDQSYRPGHRHTGLDIFPGTQVGVNGVYVAYPGYLSRLPDWKSTVIIRIPSDPLQPDRQIWTYYTHMADSDGNSLVDTAFPQGTSEVYVEAGAFLGYAGDYSGKPANPTGLHLHFSIVKDDGSGSFLNETKIRNTYDPTPYFNLPVNNYKNSTEFPTCPGDYTIQDWDLQPADIWDDN